MPIYVYESKQKCNECGGRFEVLQSLDEPALTACPTCGKSCEKVIASFSCGKGSLGFDLTQAKASGMKVLKRRDKGVYESL